MAAKNSFQFDTTVTNSVARLINSSISYTIKLLEARAIKLQGKFFFSLVTLSGGKQVFDASKAPTFPGISQPQPDWAPLSDSYAARKASDDFYVYKSKLIQNIASLDAIGVFGKPLVYYQEPGKGGNVQITSNLKSALGGSKIFATIASSGKVQLNSEFLSTGKLGKITLDLFPKITSIKKGFRYSDFFRKDIAMKIDYYGNKESSDRRPRTFLPQYMEWWLKTKSKEILQGVKK